MKFSELITKPVISIFESVIEGVVIDAVFNESSKKIKMLILENNSDTQNEDELFLNVKDIYSIGQDALMIRNKFALTNNKSELSTQNNPLNFNVFTTNGNSLGRISDLELDDNFNILLYYCGDNNFNTNQIASIKNGIILINTEEHTINVSKFKHKHKVSNNTNEQQQKAIILPLIQSNNSEQIFNSPYLSYPQIDNESFETKSNENEAETTSTPIPRTYSFNENLIGKTITHNIIAQNGELIAKQGGIVTANTIHLASIHQKLRELRFYVK